MGKWIVRLLTVVLLGVFAFSAVKLWQIRNYYKTGEEIYGSAVEQYTQKSSYVSAPAKVERPAAQTGEAPEVKHDGVYAPILVDFDRLQAVNDEVIGWIYCENSVINYPIVHANNNDFYLHRSYTKASDPCGSIFSDGNNTTGFFDSNTILYGHHMQNMSMFATLKYWLEQDYYEEHPVMWILTPMQDYRLELFSCYETPATSDSYTIYYGPDQEFDAYLNRVAARSAFTPHDVELDGQAKYVMLSTCAYSFHNARTVLHGKLVPVDSVGGYPFD